MYNRHTQVNQSAEIDEGSPTVESSGPQTDASTMPSTLYERKNGANTHSISPIDKDKEVCDNEQETRHVILRKLPVSIFMQMY